MAKRGYNPMEEAEKAKKDKNELRKGKKTTEKGKM